MPWIIRVQFQELPCGWGRDSVVTIDEEIVEDCCFVIKTADTERGPFVGIRADEERDVDELPLGSELAGVISKEIAVCSLLACWVPFKLR